MTEQDFIKEFESLLEQAGIDKASIEFTDEVRTSPRSYAAVEPYHDVPHFLFAPEVLELPVEHRRGLIMHEIGHVLCAHLPNGGTEDDADDYANEMFGVNIDYDCRWPGKGLQKVVIENPVPPEGITHEVIDWQNGDFSIIIYDQHPIRRGQNYKKRRLGSLRAFWDFDNEVFQVGSAAAASVGKGLGRYLYRLAAKEAESRGSKLCSNKIARSEFADNFWSAERKKGFVDTELLFDDETGSDEEFDCYESGVPGPRENPFRTKKEAVDEFIDHNRYTGLDFDYEYGTDAFDNINDITGARITTLREAIEIAIPPGRPFDLADIDLELLNDSDVVRRAEVTLSLPPEAEVRRQYKERYGDDYEKIMEPPQPRPLTPAERISKTAKLITSFLRKRATPQQKLSAEIEVAELAELPARGLKPSFQQLIYTLNNELGEVEKKVKGYRLFYLPPRKEKRDYGRTRGDVTVTIPASLRWQREGSHATGFYKTPSRLRRNPAGSFLSLATINKYEPMMRREGVSKVARSQRGFLTAYKRAGGKSSKLSDNWKRKRKAFIARHMAQVKQNKEPLMEDGKPTRRHLALIAWAYSPKPSSL